MSRALQAIVFDFDGVIANSEPLHLRAFQQTLAQEGIELTAADYYAKYLGFDDVGAFAAVARDRGIALSDRQIASLVASKGVLLQEMLQSGSVLFPGAKAFVEAAASAVPVAIASGAHRHEIEEIVRGAGIDHLFSAIVGAGDTPEGKPSPQPYLLAFERLRDVTGKDLQPHRTVAIEDSRWGLDSARGAGLRCVGVTTSYTARELPGAELLVEGLAALTVDALEHLVAEALASPSGSPRV